MMNGRKKRKLIASGIAGMLAGSRRPRSRSNESTIVNGATPTAPGVGRAQRDLAVGPRPRRSGEAAVAPEQQALSGARRRTRPADRRRSAGGGESGGVRPPDRAGGSVRRHDRERRGAAG